MQHQNIINCIQKYVFIFLKSVSFKHSKILKCTVGNTELSSTRRFPYSVLQQLFKFFLLNSLICDTMSSFVKRFRNCFLTQFSTFTAPASCRYETKSDSTLLTSDYLQFAASATDCMDQCDAETAFNCWAYSYVDNRCQLSGDSSLTWGKDAALPSHPGAVYGELKCFFGNFFFI